MDEETKDGEDGDDPDAEEEDPERKNLQKPNKQNGGFTDKFTWTQTLEELHILIEIPMTVKAKNIKVDAK